MEAASSGEPAAGLAEACPPKGEGDEADEELFGTETMAELCARQGRLGEAIAIYRRLLAGAPEDRRERMADRLASLERARARSSTGESTSAPKSPTPVAPKATDAPAAAGTASAPRPAPAPRPPYRPALVVRQPVRGGQVVHAIESDLVVLAPVNPGGRVVADGHIHVYAPLRGTAIAGAAGSADARIFCRKLDAELLAVCGVYVTAEEIPAELVGRSVEVSLRDGRCVISPL